MLNHIYGIGIDLTDTDLYGGVKYTHDINPAR